MWGQCDLDYPPASFWKTLSMSMPERFFSLKYAGRGELFEGFAIWKEQKYRDLQGTYPVIGLTFANIKETNFETTRQKINEILVELYQKHSFLKDSGLLGEKEIQYFDSVSPNMDDSTASLTLHRDILVYDPRPDYERLLNIENVLLLF